MIPGPPESYCVLADAFAYPSPGLRTTLSHGIRALPEGSVRERYRVFVRAVDNLPLGDWEELYTRTLDLNPLVAPYVGYHAWGDSYRRGPFLGLMNRAIRETGTSTMGELPDHIVPVLRYLAAAPAPLPELLDALGPAVDHMVSTLQKAERNNPYVNLFRAVQAFLVIEAKDAEQQVVEAT